MTVKPDKLVLLKLHVPRGVADVFLFFQTPEKFGLTIAIYTLSCEEQSFVLKKAH